MMKKKKITTVTGTCKRYKFMHITQHNRSNKYNVNAHKCNNKQNTNELYVNISELAAS